MTYTAKQIQQGIRDFEAQFLEAHGEFEFTQDQFANLMIDGWSFPEDKYAGLKGHIDLPGLGTAVLVEYFDEPEPEAKDGDASPIWLVFSLAGQYWRIEGVYITKSLPYYPDFADMSRYGTQWRECSRLIEVKQVQKVITVFEPLAG